MYEQLGEKKEKITYRNIHFVSKIDTFQYLSVNYTNRENSRFQWP